MKRGFAAQFGERFTRRLFGWLKFLSPQQASGYFGIVTTARRVVVPHFRFKKDLNTLFEFIPRCKQRGIQI
jgi:hypothetical protein